MEAIINKTLIVGMLLMAFAACAPANSTTATVATTSSPSTPATTSAASTTGATGPTTLPPTSSTTSSPTNGFVFDPSTMTGTVTNSLFPLTVGSRWADKVNDAIVRYLKAGGIDVACITKRNQWAGDAFAMTLEEGLNLALEVGREAARLAPEADGVSVPGGAAMSLHVIPAIEEEFGKPAFTNMSTEVWNDLVRPGIIPPVEGWGCLLANRRHP